MAGTLEDRYQTCQKTGEPAQVDDLLRSARALPDRSALLAERGDRHDAALIIGGFFAGRDMASRFTLNV
jgi:hypothetical protein